MDPIHATIVECALNTHQRDAGMEDAAKTHGKP